MLKLRLILAFNDWTSRPTLMGSHILGRPNFILIIQFSWIIPPKLSKVLHVVGQEEGGIVHPPEINFQLMFLDWKNTVGNDLLTKCPTYHFYANY